MYYIDGADDASSSLIFLSWMDSSPVSTAGMEMQGQGGVWWACKYKLSNFIKALNYGKKCSSDSDCDVSGGEYCDTYNPDGATCIGYGSGSNAKVRTIPSSLSPFALN